MTMQDGHGNPLHMKQGDVLLSAYHNERSPSRSGHEHNPTRSNRSLIGTRFSILASDYLTIFKSDYHDFDYYPTMIISP